MSVLGPLESLDHVISLLQPMIFRKRISPTFYLAGFQKTASTWLYRVFLDHPEVFVPDKDAIHYLTIKHYLGEKWYADFYRGYRGEKHIGDTTPSYMQYPYSRERMKESNPDAKILVTLRNPIERAFSHYWHEKKKRTISFEFADILESNNVNNFDAYIGSGFYYRHLSELFRLFPRENVLVSLFDDLTPDPQKFLNPIFDFLEIQRIRPSVIDQQINVARKTATPMEQEENRANGRPVDETEYTRGINNQTRKKLRDVYSEENKKLEDLIGRDLSSWR